MSDFKLNTLPGLGTIHASRAILPGDLILKGLLLEHDLTSSAAEAILHAPASVDTKLMDACHIKAGGIFMNSPAA